MWKVVVVELLLAVGKKLIEMIDFKKEEPK